MRILQICAAYKPAFIYGGPTMSVSKLSEQLQAAGIETAVFATTANGGTELPVNAGEKVNVDGVPVTYFKRITGDHSHLSPALLKALWCDAEKFDVIHIHAWWNLVSVFSCLIALIKNRRVVVSPRGTLSPYSFQNKNATIKKLIHRFISMPLLAKCDIHVTSQREREAMEQLIKPKRIFDLPNFISLPDKKAVLKTEKAACFKLIFFSRIEEKKGLELLIGALSKVEFPVKLTIAGSGNDVYLEKLKTLAFDRQVGDKINWIGFQQENKFDLLREHDLFILPSYDENFGNAVIESLSVGTAVLISEQVGLADYVSKNSLGWICKTDENEIADAINTILLNEQEVLQNIRSNAPEIIFADFNESKLVKKYVAMYNQIIQK